MLKIVSKNLTCPSCGRKGAVIEVLQLTFCTEISIYHDYCGYRIPITDYVQSVLDTPRKEISVNIQEINHQKLLVSSSDWCSVYPVISLFKNTKGYFTMFCFSLNGKLSKLECPVCAKILLASRDKIVCTDGHFEIPPSSYFESLIAYPFKSEINSKGSEITFKISCEQKSDNLMIKTFYQEIATVIYRYNCNKDERVLLVDSTVGTNSENYQKFLKFIKEKGAPYFTIIEKIHPK